MTHYSNTPNPVDFPKLSTVDRLWGKALDRAVPDTYSTLTWTQVEKIKTVFAELMVDEVYDYILNATFDDEPWPDRKDVKKHFGVEE